MFRVEVLEARKRKLHGGVFLTQPISFLIITLTVASILALAIILLFTGFFARSEHVAGSLVPSKGLVKIQASQFDTLSAQHVCEGATVSKGQKLADIQVSHQTADGRSFVVKSLEALSRQKAALDTQIALDQNQLEAELAKLSSERAGLVLCVQSLGEQIALQKQSTASAKAAYKDVQGILEKGYISKVESERRCQTWLSQQAQEQLPGNSLKYRNWLRQTLVLKRALIQPEQRMLWLKQRLT